MAVRDSTYRVGAVKKKLDLQEKGKRCGKTKKREGPALTGPPIVNTASGS